MQCCRVRGLFQAPGVFHAGPALLWLAVHRAGAELAFGKGIARRFVQAVETGCFFNLRLQHTAIGTNQKFQRDGAFFFEAT